MGLLVNTWELIDEDRCQGKSWDEIGERHFYGTNGSLVKAFYDKYAAEVKHIQEMITEKRRKRNDQD